MPGGDALDVVLDADHGAAHPRMEDIVGREELADPGARTSSSAVLASSMIRVARCSANFSNDSTSSRESTMTTGP
jgi:hypothetical protein